MTKGSDGSRFPFGFIDSISLVFNSMKYPDGQEIRAGDKVIIDGRYEGLVIACINTNDFLPGHEDWDYLKDGIMVDTSYCGLVHYSSDSIDDLELQSRRSIP